MCQLIPPSLSCPSCPATQKRQQQQLGCRQLHSFPFSKIFHPDGASGERKGGNTTAKEAAEKRAKGLLKRGRNFSPSSSKHCLWSRSRARTEPEEVPSPFLPLLFCLSSWRHVPPSVRTTSPREPSQRSHIQQRGLERGASFLLLLTHSSLSSPPPLPPDREKRKRGPHCWYAWERRRRRKLGGGRRRGGN